MATNFVKASYQEIIDFSTTSGKLAFLGFHAPTGDRPYKMLRGFFEQYQKYRYLGCRVSAIQPAQLPADPLQISYEAGEQTIDPRDMVNPILFKGVHGETIDSVLDDVYNNGGLHTDSADLSEISSSIDSGAGYEQYYTWMTSQKFRKMAPTNGFRISMYPLTWKMSTLQPIPNSAVAGDLSNSVKDQAGVFVSGSNRTLTGDWATKDQASNGDGSMYARVVTSGAQRLGWLPTRHSRSSDAAADIVPGSPEAVSGKQMVTQYHESINPLPKIYMGLLVFPPANKILWSYRMIITHSFVFKGFGTAPSADLSIEAGQSTGSGITQFGSSLRDSPYSNWLDKTITAKTASVTAVNADAVTKIDSVS